jgi:hypothetical protein
MLGEDYWRDGAAGANVTGVFNKMSLKLGINYCSGGGGTGSVVSACLLSNFPKIRCKSSVGNSTKRYRTLVLACC